MIPLSCDSLLGLLHFSWQDCLSASSTHLNAILSPFCCGLFVHSVFRSLSAWIISYVIVDLLHPWEEWVQLQLPFWTLKTGIFLIWIVLCFQKYLYYQMLSNFNIILSFNFLSIKTSFISQLIILSPFFNLVFNENRKQFYLERVMKCYRKAFEDKHCFWK